jgi:hypothetical protein
VEDENCMEIRGRALYPINFFQSGRHGAVIDQFVNVWQIVFYNSLWALSA